MLYASLAVLTDPNLDSVNQLANPNNCYCVMKTLTLSLNNFSSYSPRTLTSVFTTYL